MNVYMYEAALYCETCGQQIRAELDAAGKRPTDPEREDSYDSGDYPKGPYPDGGGEADTPQHCDHCDTFLENPLTSDGRAYVVDAIFEAFDSVRRGDTHAADRPSLQIWAPHYDMDTIKGLIEALDP